MKTQTHVVLILGLAVSTAASAATPASVAAVLATPDQRSTEALAIRILRAPAVAGQIAISKRLLLETPVANEEEARSNLDEAVKELAFAATLEAVNGDPGQPKVVWAFTAPRTWLGHSVPGSRWGIDNPDNVYRFVPVDGLSRYELTVRPSNPGPVQYSFLIYDSFVGENGRQDHLDAPLAALRDRDVKANPDGSFTVTIDNTPANGRPNHLQTSPDATVLLIRNTFNDWSTQVPQTVTVRRIDGPPAPARSESQVVARAVELIDAATHTLAGWETRGFASDAAPNTVSRPFARGGGWGFAANGRFHIASDEALVVTLDPVGARYVGFDLTDPWLVSREHIASSGSLNNKQARPNVDGTFTYVIAARDPGVENWADTGGLHDGKLLIRWQVLPETATADKAVREVKVVKLSQLRAALPEGFETVNPAERRSLQAARAREYAHRYSATATADGQRLATVSPR